MFIFKERI